MILMLSPLALVNSRAWPRGVSCLSNLPAFIRHACLRVGNVYVASVKPLPIVTRPAMLLGLFAVNLGKAAQDETNNGALSHGHRIKLFSRLSASRLQRHYRLTVLWYTLHVHVE